MTDSLTQKASLITDGASNYSIQNGVWADVGAIPTGYAAKEVFFEDNGFRSLTQAQMVQLKTLLSGGKGKFLTLAKIDLTDFFGDGSGVHYLPFSEDIGLAEINGGVLPTFESTNGIPHAVFNGESPLKLAIPSGYMTKDFSFSFYMQQKSSRQNSMITTVYPTGTGTFGIYAGYLYLSDPSSPQLVTPVPSARIHVTINVLNGNTSSIFIDGVLNAEYRSGDYTSAGNYLSIGGTSGFNYYGTLDTFRFFNRTVTAAEAIQLSNEAR